MDDKKGEEGIVYICHCGHQFFWEWRSVDGGFELRDCCPKCNNWIYGGFYPIETKWGKYISDAVWFRPWTWLRGHFEFEEEITNGR